MAVYRFGDCVLDLQTRELRVAGRVVHLEPQVLDVLGYLVAHRDRVVSKAELLDTVWGSRFVSETALTSRIKSARSAIGDDGAGQTLIRTLRGSGYRFVGEVTEVAGSEPVAATARDHGNLPAARGALVGRVTELAELRPLLERHRAVTISGPGGAGKSSIALEVVRTTPRRPGGEVAFVDLAPARDLVDVVRAIAEAVGVEGPGASDLAVLATNVAARDLLLILDNCEHLLDPSAEVVHGLLDAGPQITIVATSREPLGVNGEATYLLGSLGADAATLFVERAAATGHTDLRADDPVVVDLCERLDGLPLAIELAAAQLRHLTLSELVGRLDHRLAILVGGRPRAGDRHAALATTIEWSYQLLAPGPRDLFERLGVVPAQFDFATAQAVSVDADLVATTHTVADLVAKSLVVHDRDRGRYRMLESIRMFAVDRLEESGHRPEVRERLRRHVVGLIGPEGRGQAWLSLALPARYRDDIDTVRAALDWSIQAGAYGEAIDLMVGLSTLWRTAVSYAEGLQWTKRLEALDLSDRDRLWLRILTCDLGLGSGDPRLMADAAAAALELAGRVDDPAAAAIAATYDGLTHAVHPERAVSALRAAASIAEEADEHRLSRLARAYRVASLLAAGRRAEADAEVRDLPDPTVLTEHGYDRYIGIWAGWLVGMVDRDGARMSRLMDAQIDNVTRSGLRENWLTVYCRTLSCIAAGEEFRPHLRQARHRAEAEGRNAELDCVLALAYLAACRGDGEAAAELVGASGGGLFRDTANFVHHMIIRDCVVRPMVAEARYQAAAARGRARSAASILAEHGL